MVAILADLFCGFVPVAPIVELKEDALAKVGVPTMPVRGEKDEQGKGTDRMLSHIRTSTQVQVGHTHVDAAELVRYSTWATVTMTVLGNSSWKPPMLLGQSREVEHIHDQLLG